MRRLITERTQLTQLFASLQGQEKIAIDLETTGLGYMFDEIHGVVLATADFETYVMGDALPQCYEILRALDGEFKPIWIGHHIKFDMHFLRRVGVELTNIADTMVMMWLLDSSETLRLKYLADIKLGVRGMPTFGQLQGRVKAELKLPRKEDATIEIMFQHLPEEMLDYACRDGRLTYDLYEKLYPNIVAEGFEEMFWEHEMPFVKVLHDMEHNGFAVDLDRVEELRIEYEERFAELERQWQRLVGPLVAKYFQRGKAKFINTWADVLNEYHPERIAEDHPMHKSFSRKRMSSYDDLMQMVADMVDMTATIAKLDPEQPEQYDEWRHGNDGLIRSFADDVATLRSHVDRFWKVWYSSKKKADEDPTVQILMEMVMLFSMLFEGANYNSDQQLITLFYGILKLKNTRTTKSGQPSVDKLSLIRFNRKDKSGAVDLLQDLRLYGKMLSTYIYKIQNENINGRIHCSLNHTGTETTRLSSDNPNLQNIPARGGVGKELRGCFVAPAGKKLIVCDFSQIELRVIAHYCKDQTMISVFEEGRDPHQETADRFGIERPYAKEVNFGIPYGMSWIGLSDSLEEKGLERPPKKFAEELIDGYPNIYPGWKKWKASAIRYARELGYVRTIGGHRRILHDINSPINGARGKAERMAVNTIIQGSASDIIKHAMLSIHRQMWWFGEECKMLMQVHDELIFEVPEGVAEEFAEFVQYEMEKVKEVFQIIVPVLAEPNIGMSWAEAK